MFTIPHRRRASALCIAATAKSAGLVLVTLNPRHFEGLEGLAVEDWSK